MLCAPSRWCYRIVAVVVLAGGIEPLSAADPAPAPRAVDPDRLLLRGAFTQIPRGTDAHGKALWAFARYQLAPDKDMYDAAWDAHKKGDPLGNMKVSSKAKAQAVGRDATALLTACGLALRSFD